jgi:GntR family transcriptional regulator
VIEFRIDRRAGLPTYLQIVQQTRQALLLGRLRVGDQLPTAREVVASTGINPNTVLKAYRELDREGLVETRVGAGTFVIATPGRAVAAQESAAGEALGAWLRQARASGLDRAEVEALAKAWIEDVYQKER